MDDGIHPSSGSPGVHAGGIGVSTGVSYIWPHALSLRGIQGTYSIVCNAK